ncbi:MAG: dihydroneopterin aldolase [Deltaproteobacteria bacterium]|nr:MAG: dihydroneopterin aldolase [Deltaproteobacteria bacterium]
MRDVIAIRDLAVDCIVGVYPHERDTPQRLVLDVELELDTEEAARSENISHTVNYDLTSAQLVFLLQSCRFQLIETAAHALCRYLLAPPAPGIRRAQIGRVRLTMSKPEALGGAAVPSLAIERDAEWAGAFPQEQKSFGLVDVIHETTEAGIYRLNLEPGGVIPMHMHRQMNESEMVLGEGLRCQGAPAAPGLVRRWPHGAPHTYENPTAEYQSILCVDCPPFIAEDEIEVDAPPAVIEPEPEWRSGPQ